MTGQVGSLVALLDAVLRVGYGSQTAAGWTKDYTATNKATFRNSASTGTGFYLDVDDSAPSTAKEARVRGYEVMTAVATGTGGFPTAAQMTSGLFVRKSNTADSTARPWYILADDTVFYLFVESGDYTAPTRATAFAFGDFYSYKASDAYRCMIMGRDTENNATQQFDRFALMSDGSSGVMTLTTAGHYIARGTAATGGSIAFGIHADLATQGYNTSYQNVMGQSFTSNISLAYPNPADNGIYMAPAYIHHNGGLRGYLKGLWCPSQQMPLGHLDTFTGTGAMSAKSFLCLQMATYNNSNNVTAECFLETSNTWS